VAVAWLLASAGCRLPWSGGGGRPEESLTPQEREQFARAEDQLRSPDAAERQQAAVALLSMAHPLALEAVLKNVREAADPAVRVSMVQAAAFSVDHRCFAAVLAALDDPDPQVQAAAAQALGRFSQPEEVDALVALVRRDGLTLRQRQLLFTALGEGLAFRAVPVLIHGLQSEDDGTRAAALEALRRISRRQMPPDVAQWEQWWEANAHRTRADILEEHLQAQSRELAERGRELAELRAQQEELLALAASPQSETPAMLLEALASRYGAVRQYASGRLAALNKEKLGAFRLDERDHHQALLDALQNDPEPVRRNVMRFVVQVQGTYRDALVSQALSDSDPQVLVTAIEAVEVSTGQEAVSRLQELLTNSAYVPVREAAANALGRVGSDKSVPVLMAALDDAAENVRWFAVEGLRKLGAGQAVPRVSEMLEKDPSPRVREIAASTLGELGQPAAVPALRKALDDGSERVRQKAVSALLALASGSYERMKIIADLFRSRRLLEPARQVLSRIVEQYADAPQLKAQLAEVYGQLAQVQKEAADAAGAARTYQKLDELLGGSAEVRREMVNCWLQAGQASSVVKAVEQWLGSAQAADREALIQLALDATEQLAGSQRPEEAKAVLDLAARAFDDTTGQALKDRMSRLRRQLGMAEPAS
jgi:HEAT repeat protein